MELEKDPERLLKREIEKLGGLCFKIVSPGMRGVPDRVALLPNGEVHFLEMKTASGRPSVQQIAFKRKIEKRHGNAKILYGTDDVRAFVQWAREALEK